MLCPSPLPPLRCTSIRFTHSVAMAAQVGTALHAHQTCQLPSGFQGLRASSGRAPHHHHLQLNPSQVPFAASSSSPSPRRCLTVKVRANSPSGAGASGDSGAAAASSTAKKTSSILCQSCDGNGAVACSQCHGGGVNTEDHFNGRFKAGSTCWLCRGKRQMLCGNCNGAGFMGGFMNTQDE